ncbi:DNA-binding protein [Paraphysoderma sedebokerense]|nr:DNA-binding protein [Paraphysoderma sedebokerense]
MSAKLSHADLVHVLVEFLEVIFHEILYIRDLYPGHLFEKRQKYNTPVMMCRSNLVIQYIRDVVSSLKEDISNGLIDKLYIKILSPQRREVERFVFEFTSLLPPLTSAKDSKNTPVAFPLPEIELYLRSFIKKLSIADSSLRPNPEGCTFEIVMELNETAMNQANVDMTEQAQKLSIKVYPQNLSYPISNSNHLIYDSISTFPSLSNATPHLPTMNGSNQSSPWVPVDPPVVPLNSRKEKQKQHMNIGDSQRSNFSSMTGCGDSVPQLLPIKSMDVGVIKIQLYVEESDVKEDPKVG